MSNLALTDTRREVLENMAKGRKLVYSEHVLSQPTRYYWQDNREIVHAATVKPMEKAGWIAVDPHDYWGRILTSTGRSMLR